MKEILQTFALSVASFGSLEFVFVCLYLWEVSSIEILEIGDFILHWGHITLDWCNVSLDWCNVSLDWCNLSLKVGNVLLNEVNPGNFLFDFSHILFEGGRWGHSYRSLCDWRKHRPWTLPQDNYKYGLLISYGWAEPFFFGVCGAFYCCSQVVPLKINECEVYYLLAGYFECEGSLFLRAVG